MDPDRPSPEALLAEANAAEGRGARGRLKVFFGAAPGVGKTFAMLSEARRRRLDGVDVVVGYIEPHARPETLALLDGLELLPPKRIPYRGIELREFDLDAALARRPALLLVDELAHTNAEGSRYARRSQDIEELLAAGIDVYTTLNVQHLESLNDIVAQITGVTVRETIPDEVFERADEVELVDLTPLDLQERLQSGKVYIPEEAARATQHFFRLGNLAALRELALRATADRVGAEVETARGGKSWPTAERLLVCVGPSPSSARIVRGARRLANALKADWIALFVETPRGMSDLDRARLARNLRLAERLGAETVTLSGTDVVAAIIDYARSRNVTRIVLGKTERPRLLDWFGLSPLDILARSAAEIDVMVIRGTEVREEEAVERPPPRRSAPDWAGHIGALLIVLAATAAGLLLLSFWADFSLVNLAMLYLLGVAYVSARHGFGPSAVSTVAGVLAFDFCFVPPRWTFAVADAQYILTFGVMLGVGFFISTLGARLREQAALGRRGERRAESMLRMTQRLADAPDLAALLSTARAGLEEAFGGTAVLYLPSASGGLELAEGVPLSEEGAAEGERGVALWAFEHARPAGRGTDTLPAARALCVPLLAARGSAGVIGLRVPDSSRLLSPEPRALLLSFARQIALAIERLQLAAEARRSQVESEMERLRSALLSSASHDLRTPLTVIAGSAQTLLAPFELDRATARGLLTGIHDEAIRLSRLVTDLLDITRLESGSIQLDRQWIPIEEVVGSALRRVETALSGRPVRLDLPADLPLVHIDPVLVEQLFVNLLENVAKYSPAGAPIAIGAEREGDEIAVRIEDEGPGFAPGEEERVFEKFYRGSAARAGEGIGLGLAICRAMVEVHGGRIRAENRPRRPDGRPGGARFRFTFPLTPLPASRAESDP